MAQRASANEEVRIGTEPNTEFDCKSVMLRAERGDTVVVDDVREEFCSRTRIPSELRVVRRSNTFYGPKLEAKGTDSNWMITSPGPDAQILLWKAVSDDDFIQGWEQVAEVVLSFSEGNGGYDMCPVCNEPLRTLEHERLAAVGKCSK